MKFYCLPTYLKSMLWEEIREGRRQTTNLRGKFYSAFTLKGCTDSNCVAHTWWNTCAQSPIQCPSLHCLEPLSPHEKSVLVLSPCLTSPWPATWTSSFVILLSLCMLVSECPSLWPPVACLCSHQPGPPEARDCASVTHALGGAQSILENEWMTCPLHYEDIVVSWPSR